MALSCLAGRRLSCLLLTLVAMFTLAQAANATELLIYNSSSTYHYIGCWNETTNIAGTSGARALPDISLEQPEIMTVEICLDFCAHNQSTAYKYAGLEYSRQCWCAKRLSSLSTQLDDAACDTQCDGNQAEACGGALKLSLYNITTVGGTSVAMRSGILTGSLLGLLSSMAVMLVII